MKILMITDTHDPKAGGAEKYFFRLKEELKKQKEISVYSLGFGKANKTGKDYTIIKETRFLSVRHFWRMFFNPRIYKKIRGYIERINPDIIHLHNVNKYTVSLLKAIRGYKVVQTVHDYGLLCPSLWNIHKNLEPCPTGFRLGCLFQHRRNNWPIYLSLLFHFYRRNRLLKKFVQTFIVPSYLLKDYLQKNRFVPVYFIPLFIDEKKPRKRKINWNQIFYAGPLEENKGVDVLLKEFSQLIKQFPLLALKIAGKGSDEARLKELTKRLGIEKRIHFLGWVQDLQQLYETSAFVIVPSLTMEQFGLVTAEAMMLEKAVIGSNRGGTTWLIKNKETGLLFNPAKKGDLAAKIEYLLKNKKKCSIFGKKGRQRIRELCNSKRDLKKIIEIYNKL